MARSIDPRTAPRIRRAAAALFYAHGIAATSLDEVVRASGLTKPTFYRYFPSKEALVAAYLDDRQEQYDLELRTRIEAVPPRKRPLAVIDWVCESISNPGFNGCEFVRAYAEQHADRRIREKARKRKRVLLEAIEDACRAASVKHPRMLARELALLVEGANTMAFVNGDSRTALEAVRGLARAALRAAGADDS